MSKRGRAAGLLIAALSAALAGCSAGAATGTPAQQPAPPRSRVTSLATPAATWAVVQTGGRAAGGRFWQLLVRQGSSSAWRLVTPPGVADNGGLVIAPGGQGLVAAFVPSQLLRFTPLAITTDNGAHWSQGLLPARLVAAPGALAVMASGRLLAATAKGVEESAHDTTGWSLLVSLRTLAATPAARACGLTRLTAVGQNQSGAVLAGGQCSHPGIAVVFQQVAGGWRAAVLKLTGSLAGRTASVLRLTAATLGASALFVAATRSAQRTFAAHVNGTGSKLTERGSSYLAGQKPSGFFASSGRWGVATAGRFALVPGLDTVAVWHEDKSSHWRKTQVVSVPSAPG